MSGSASRRPRVRVAALRAAERSDDAEVHAVIVDELAAAAAEQARLALDLVCLAIFSG
jgi:hypothetical protein